VPTDPGPSSCPYSPTTYTPPAPLLRALCGLQTVLTAVFTKIELISQRGSPTKRGNVSMAHYHFGPKRGFTCPIMAHRKFGDTTFGDGSYSSSPRYSL
jgi:hypothetical protein